MHSLINIQLMKPDLDNLDIIIARLPFDLLIRIASLKNDKTSSTSSNVWNVLKSQRSNNADTDIISHLVYNICQNVHVVDGKWKNNNMNVFYVYMRPYVVHYERIRNMKCYAVYHLQYIIPHVYALAPPVDCSKTTPSASRISSTLRFNQPPAPRLAHTWTANMPTPWRRLADAVLPLLLLRCFRGVTGKLFLTFDTGEASRQRNDTFTRSRKVPDVHPLNLQETNTINYVFPAATPVYFWVERLLSEAVVQCCMVYARTLKLRIEVTHRPVGLSVADRFPSSANVIEGRTTWIREG